MPLPRGRFITFEGGEGAGKSTQSLHLADRLRGCGLGVRLTREPGGTDGAEAIRELIVHGPVERWRPLSELCLFMAARDDHLHRAILPALTSGEWVVCDRFADSSRVYQGYAGGLGLALVDRLQEPLLGEHMPDLTLLLDLPVETGMARCAERGAMARFEAKGRDYHEQVRQGFLALADTEPDRFVILDAAAGEAEVAAAVWRAVVAKFKLPTS
ncbi:MAG: dTMP kinase [Geminicoccaceae bacterium]